MQGYKCTSVQLVSGWSPSQHMEKKQRRKFNFEFVLEHYFLLLLFNIYNEANRKDIPNLPALHPSPQVEACKLPSQPDHPRVSKNHGGHAKFKWPHL